jgi:geranylgeranyl diphosphate synthase type I
MADDSALTQNVQESRLDLFVKLCTRLNSTHTAETIRTPEGDRLKLLSDDQLQQIEAHLDERLARLFAAEGLAPVNEVVRRYELAGGKRLRPQLCIWTWEHAAGRGQQAERESAVRDADGLLPEALLDLACAWELFHAFLLAHDDIIDNAETRRGRPSLHRQLAALDGNTRHFGMSLGIVAGDLMFSAAMQLWHEIDLPAEVYRQELKLLSRIARLTGFGQAIDICQSHNEIRAVDEQLLLREYHWKTAAYTFEGPMRSAAILARASEDAQSAISRFALALGQAYQLQNDLVDLSQPAHPGADLVQGKRTVALLRARAAMPEHHRAEFDRRLGELRHANGSVVTLAESLRKELFESGAIEQTRHLIVEFLTTCELAAHDPAMPAPLASGLLTLLDSLRMQYFSPSGLNQGACSEQTQL